MRRLAAFSLALILLCAPAGAATLTSSIESTALEMGDSVTLIISLSGGDSAQPPDLTALTRDFTILDRRRGSRQALVDGKPVTVNDWVLTLAPRRAGALTIPAFSLAGATSAPIRIDVTAAAQPAKVETRPLFIDVAVGKGAVYAQGEIPVYVRVYDSLGMRSGSIDQIKAEGASFREEGEQDSYVRTIGKTRYHVVEQTYIMTPQRSGPIEIEPVTLKATIPVPYNSSPSEMARMLGRGNVPMPWLDGSLTRGQEVSLHSDKVTVEVLPRPAQAEGWFLPARAVTVRQSWSGDPAKGRVGETLTRTLIVEAVGASPNQMPPIQLPDVDGLRQYEEDTQTRSAVIDRQQGAALTKVIAVVPSRAGTFTLPPVTIGWWNTDRKVQEQTTLPAVTLTVAALPGAAAPPPPQAEAPAARATRSEDAPQPAPPPAAGSSILTAGLLSALAGLGEVWSRLKGGDAGWLGALALGLALLVALAFAPGLLRRRSHSAGGGVSARSRLGFAPSAARAGSEQALTRAAKANDAAATYAAYLDLSRTATGRGLAEPAPRTAEFQAALRELRAHLFGAPGGHWDGKGFLAAWRKETGAAAAARRKRRGPEGLRPLYPEA